MTVSQSCRYKNSLTPQQLFSQSNNHNFCLGLDLGSFFAAMDTALITFMMHTSPSTQSVHLVGSWDNFTKHYPMERDIKRSRGQWRGCYTFEDIICEVDGRSIPRRTGGLKMGSTYYYYYELDDGTEHYDPTIPFTTACTYMPGQPVNILYVPIEIQPLRFRSASMTSMTNGDIKTMNPADKFMSPRQPPPTPALPRLNTSPSALAYKRSARSVSPKAGKQWSPRAFFGLRSPLPSSPVDNDPRGRSDSLSRVTERSASQVSLASRRDESRKLTSATHSRDTSPQSFMRSHSREPSPLRQLAADINIYNTAALTIPDEITEEAEDDDDNFASDLSRNSISERGLITQLSPPPSSLRSSGSSALPSLQGTDKSKPLPQLPEESMSPLLPSLLLIHPSGAQLPRSHFSTSTISTNLTSPTDSHFGFSETPSISDSCYEDNLDAESGDDSSYSPILEQAAGRGFSGYSLPDGDYASEQTLRKNTPLSPLKDAATRTTFGSGAELSPITTDSNMSALEQLMSEMGYLGDMIAGK